MKSRAQSVTNRDGQKFTVTLPVVKETNKPKSTVSHRLLAKKKKRYSELSQGMQQRYEAEKELDFSGIGSAIGTLGKVFTIPLYVLGGISVISMIDKK